MNIIFTLCSSFLDLISAEVYLETMIQMSSLFGRIYQKRSDGERRSEPGKERKPKQYVIK